MTEVVLLGNVAVRTGRALAWDRKSLRIPKDREASRLLRKKDRKGWTV